MQFIPALCKMNFQVVCTPPPAKALIHMQHGHKGYNMPHQSKASEEQTSKVNLQNSKLVPICMASLKAGYK
jgi:hypothetical protein